ncbi:MULTISPECIES: penicillin-binding protein 2 [Sulfurovum]|uniref:Penicillin-binding protein 2 n=1 Tax=Sulfurovum xiamenensis TaxID=3019066 RepID=A0ABT7QUV6_9BACT|nr:MULTISPECIES: penicillin-binding protein 2 [Sulfurovum]EIF51461.1 penicillin-binding protein 2 [Sulfurovum sp. AR]MDM5264334.1 penicillin-binding protein 2 [Sulfurovum xiamenensis]
MRYKFIVLVFLIFWAVMITRLYHVSIKSNFYYEGLAKENIERKQFIKPVRGEITDARGNLLAMNQIGFSLSIAPHLKVKNHQLENVIEKLIETFPDLNKTVMLKVYKKHNSPYNHKYIKVVDFIHYADMMGAYPKLSLIENIKIEAETKRYYPYGKYAAHIVGYTGRSNKKENEKDPVVNEVGKTGKSGLERYYNKVLEGELGYEISKVTATNKAIEVLEKELPKDNKNIQLNIDIELQKMIYERFGEDTGVAVVMRTNGEVLAAVSYPSYDPNLFVGGISSKEWKALQDNIDHPFTNKFIHGTYPPGSTIKMGMALAFSKALPNSLGAPEYCNGHITLGSSKHKFRCWSRWGHGKVDLRKAIRESCDVYFYNKSLKVGIDAMAENLRTFGLGVQTGVDLPREYAGVMPDKAWKMKRYKQPWYMGETVIAAIGQGYDLVTPLQVARYTGLIATASLAKPLIAREVDGKKIEPEIKPLSFNTYYLNEIRKGMYDVCNVRSGTAYRTMSKLPIVVAGKTGTSQVTSIPQSTQVRLKEEELAYYHRSHAWITTYAPYEDPKYIVTVLVEHGGHGGSTAGPITADIYKWLYREGYFSAAEGPNGDVDNNSLR